ncbi:MAG: peptidylprolyl isomerase [Nitrospirae bacterium]|nr:MAG: peptidylprolyl isomerase [Nitrospirota bacterium]
MFRSKYLLSLLVLAACLVVFSSAALSKDNKKKVATVEKGKKVSIEYTLKLEDGTTIDSNVGGKPFTYVQGSHQIVEGLEEALSGMKVGDTKHVVVPPEKGYGKINEKAFIEIDKSRVPKDVKVGSMLKGTSKDGRDFYVKVAEIKDKTVVLDLNHPLAGKTLYFDVKILDIE